MYKTKRNEEKKPKKQNKQTNKQTKIKPINLELTSGALEGKTLLHIMWCIHRIEAVIYCWFVEYNITNSSWIFNTNFCL